MKRKTENKKEISKEQKFLSEITDAMFKSPFANELKHELAKIILKHYPKTPAVKMYLIKDEKEPPTSRDWG